MSWLFQERRTAHTRCTALWPGRRRWCTLHWYNTSSCSECTPRRRGQRTGHTPCTPPWWPRPQWWHTACAYSLPSKRPCTRPRLVVVAWLSRYFREFPGRRTAHTRCIALWSGRRRWCTLHWYNTSSCSGCTFRRQGRRTARTLCTASSLPRRRRRWSCIRCGRSCRAVRWCTRGRKSRTIRNPCTPPWKGRRWSGTLCWCNGLSCWECTVLPLAPRTAHTSCTAAGSSRP